MKLEYRFLMALAALGLSLPAHAAPYLVPNGNFSAADGTDWNQAASADTVITYEATGGNQDGYGKIDNTAGAWGGVLVSEGGTGANPALGGGIPLSSIGSGLTAGENYTFSLDMIDFGAGGTMAGIKIESWNETETIGNSGDRNFPTTTSWETYTTDYKIEVGATRLKFVPVYANNGNGTIGFDNVGGDDTAVEPPPFVPAQIPNPGFELDPLGVDWATTETTPTYVDNGSGNPGRFVQLTDGVGAFSVLYAFNGAEVTFASLGLSPGDPYSVQVDMKLIIPGNDSTSPIGGISVVGPAGLSDVGFPPLIGDGLSWETYTIEFTTPTGSEQNQARFGLRPGKSLSGATVAFDNVSIIVPSKAPFIAEIESGTVVSWEPAGAEFSYQPQESPDGDTWTDLGPPILGDTVTSAFDEDGAEFYQVIESALEAFELVADPGFEDGTEESPSGSWSFLGSDAPVVVDDSAAAHGGNNFVRMAVDTGTETVPKTSILQQFGIGILPEDVLEFSFWVNVEINDGAVLGYSIKWRDTTGAVIGQKDGNMDSAAVGGGWTEISDAGLRPPASTDSALIEFICVTGAVAGQAGSILIDDVSLVVPLTDGSGEDIPATSSAGVQVSWPSKNGSTYQPKSSSTLDSFVDFGPAISGDGEVQSILDALTPSSKFFTITETP